MRWMFVLAPILLFAAMAWADTGDGAKFEFDPAGVQLTQAMSQAPDSLPTETPAGIPQPNRLVPGKALLLSMIIPGAGQLYAKSPIMAGVFLALEIGAWAGVAMYHSQGMKKDDEFKAYADNHWTYYDSSGNVQFDSYLDWEYYAAAQFGKDGTSGGEVYPGTINQWQDLPWGPASGSDDDKLDFLPENGFTHELDPDVHDQQYYEMIGKYNQFGAGWPGDGDQAVEGYTNYRSQAHTEWQWLAVSNSYREHYLNLRKASNDALDMSKNFTMVVLANHLASALHAGFSVSWHNRRLAREQQIEGSLEFQPRHLNGEYVNFAGLNVKF